MRDSELQLYSVTDEILLFWENQLNLFYHLSNIDDLFLGDS